MTLDRLVRDAARRDPHAVAIRCAGRQLAYGELDALAGGYARRLRDLGVARGDRVVVFADKSPETVAAFQAVLRLGAAYVPLDASVPAQRAAFVAGDCGAAAAVADAPQRAAALARGGLATLRLDEDVAPEAA